VIAFRLLAGVPVYTFALLLGFCATLGLAWIAFHALDNQEAMSRVDAGLSALLGSLVMGRAVYVAYHWAYYHDHAGEIPLVSAGGFHWSGALLGGFLGVALYAWLERKSLGALLDALLPLMAAIIIGAWIGCWIDGMAYGPIANNGWWGLPARDEWGRLEPRIPLQLIGALLTLGIFWLVDRQEGHFPGWKAAVGFLGICFELFALSFLRADPGPVWKSLRLDAWSALALMGCSVLVLWIIRNSFYASQEDPRDG
jgi:prolipoprotein diacylglyceryltransferase